MTFETAQKLSATLAQLGVGHTVQVGYAEKYAPEGATEFPAIHARVDLGIPRRYDGGIGKAIRDLEGVAEEHGLVLATSMMGDGLTFSTPPQVAPLGSLRNPWPVQT